MRPSEWPIRYKIEAVVFYVVTLAAFAWLWAGVVNWMPGNLVWPFLSLFFAALGALALYGYLRDRRRRPPRNGWDDGTL